MKEFDELLNEVLCEDARVEAPLGMEMRIALALSLEKTRRFSKRRILIEAVAATILLGVATTWVLSVSRHSSVARLTESALQPTAAAYSWANPPSTSEDSHGFASGRVSISERRHRRKAQRNRVDISPLKIEPLFIKPIEIALLTSSTTTGKGEVR